MVRCLFICASCAAVVTSSLGCGNDEPPPERFLSELAQVNESNLRAALVGNDIEILLPLERRSGGVLQADLIIELMDGAADEPTVLVSETVSVQQDSLLEEHRVVLPGAGEGVERIETALQLINWRVRLDGDDLYGRRSLYAALGSLEVQLRGPTEIGEGGTSPLRVIVRQPETSEPVTGASVTAVLVEGSGDDEVVHPLFEGATDARGELLRQIGLPAGVASGTVRVTVADDRAQVWANHNLQLRRDDRLYLSTDKTIYKPGQEIQLRLLALAGADRMPVANQEVVFEAKDGRGNKVFRRRTNTDEFGVASIAVPTDVRVNEGEWRFSAEVDGRRTELAIPVERYNLPKMRIDVTADREFALPGDQVSGELRAGYLFGEPVINGSVRLQATTLDGRLVGEASGSTDATGAFSFSFEVPEALRSEALEERGDTLSITATVVDTADQREAGGTQLPLAAAPLRLNLLPELGRFELGGENLAYLLVTDPLGRPLVADVTLSGAATDVLATNAEGIAELRVSPAADAVLEVAAVDGAGRSHARNFSLMGSESELQVVTDRGTYAEGDRAELRVFAAADVSRVYVDVYRGAANVLSTEVNLTDGEGTVALPIREELGGLLVVDAMALTDDGETLRSSRAMLVEQDSGIQVAVSSAAGTYRPGEEATLEVAVTDPAGAPQIASVGLTVVDEAAFALGGEPQVQIGQVFGFDTQVLPAGLTVAGRSASELLSTEDPAAREQLARLLFASAGDVAAPNFNYNSLAEELPQVISSMTTRVARDGENIIQSLGEMAERGFVTEENVVSMIGRMKVVDPFGRWYRLSVTETEWGGQELSIASDGPDELRDTRDDVEVKTDLFRAFYSRRAGVDDADFTGAGGPQVENAAAPPAPEAVPGEKAEATTVRADFRETALVNPTLVTDQNGRATVTFRLPDSITTWRASADGSTALGRIGSTQHRFRTFQDFFVDFSMPTELTAGDVLELPAVVYNYTDAATTVTVAMDDAPWFDLLSAPEEVVTLGPSEVRSVKFRLEVREAGEHALTVRGSGMGIADALVRSVRVDPDGQPENETFSGQVDGNATHVVTIPGDTVPNGARVEVALTPGFAAEAVQGLASMVKEPNGCFEQTTSTAWPNTLVANYLETTGQMTPEMREDIVGTVTRGYQRLLTFESPTGGINWWGNDNPEPGNRILSAIMLWHLKDLEPLIEIDTAFRDRLLDWLLSQQNADGSWDAGDALHSGNESLGTSEARTTGFIAWALAHTGWADEAVRRAAGWLGANVPTEADLYANALVANAMVLAEPGGATTNMLLGRLDTMRIDLEAGSVWHSDEPSWTGSAGDMAAVETTGLVAYGLMNAQAYPEGAAGAMRYIVSSKDSVGTWYNTQATMNALRALSAAASPMGSDAEGTLTLVVNGQTAHTIEVTRDNGDLLRTFDVTEFVQGGANDIELRMVGTGEVSYRLTRTAYRPGLPGSEGPFDLTVEYDRTQTTVGAPVTVTASARNNDRQVQNQVMVRVGRAPGFEPRYEDLDALVAAGAVARYEVRADDVTFYLMNVAPGETRPLQFRLTPGLAVEATAPASTIYSYYEPTLRQTVDAQRFTVTGGGAPGR